MNLEEIVKVGAPALQAASIAVTAYFASRGLNAWRQQLAGKRRFELAEEILVATYKVQTWTGPRSPAVGFWWRGQIATARTAGDRVVTCPKR